MHFFTIVLLNKNQLEEDGIIDRLMEPYNENGKVEPRKEYLDSSSIESGVEHYGSLSAFIENLEDWSGSKGGMDLTGVYRWVTYPENASWDWFRVGGRYDGFVTGNKQKSEDGFNFSDRHETLENNSRFVRDLPEDLRCFAIVTPDGKWHDKEDYGSGWGDNPEWDKAMLDIFSRHSDCLAVGLDCHI